MGNKITSIKVLLELRAIKVVLNVKTSRNSPKVLIAAAECSPFSKAGGLADMLHGLSIGLANVGIDVRIVMPSHRPKSDFTNGPTERCVKTLFLEDLSVELWDPWSFENPIPTYLVNSNDGTVTSDSPYPKCQKASLSRFVSLSKVAAAISNGTLDSQWTPNALHIHDWHAGLAFQYIDKGKLLKILTIHNGYYAGQFDDEALAQESVRIEGGSFLGSAITNSDCITTVSNHYAEELRTADHVPLGIRSALLGKQIHPIPNGIEYDVLRSHLGVPIPEPGHLARHAKGKTKADLQERLGWPVDPHTPLLAFTNRLTRQKCIDLLIDAIPLQKDAQINIVVHGTGDEGFERPLRILESRFPTKLRFIEGHSPKLEAEILLGSDYSFNVSRFEPFGYNQYYALFFGSLPIVGPKNDIYSKVFGSRYDLVRHARRLVVNELNTHALCNALQNAVDLQLQAISINALVCAAMTARIEWKTSITEYLKILQSARHDHVHRFDLDT